MPTSSNALNRAKSGGYTLIELAIVLVIIGALLAPAIAIYLNYEKKKDIDTTQASIDQTLTAIGGYRALYGRYPCPAPANVAPGDAAYGHEDCTLAGTPSLRTGGTYGDILVGSVPFKTMNLQESEVMDGYHSRLTYAVTENLTDSATFSMGGGGITIQDKSGSSLVTPEHGGHFIVLSHGEHSEGAVSKQGVAVGTCGSALTNEQENCDGDTVFTVGELDLNYDDRAGYFSSVQPSEWQIQEANPNNIHLRTTSNLAVGVSTVEEMTTKENAAIRSNGISDAGGVTANSDHIESSQICTGEETGTNDDCFPPSLITAESAASGATIRCPAGQVMVGVREKAAICEDEITVSCPPGQFMTGLDSDGHVLCNESLPICAGETVTTMCGESRNLPDAPSGETELTFSGQCHMIDHRDDTYFETTFTGMTQVQMSSHIQTLNTGARTAQDCGPNSGNALVRETYACDDGEWDKVAAHERRHYYSSFPSDVRSTGTSRDAEHNIAYALNADPNNNWDNHDCWCREDYRVTFENCPSGMTGTRPVVRKHTCPQTSHSNWEVVYIGLEGCGCAPSQQVSYQSCVDYYNDNNNPDISWGALDGYVTLTHDYTCVAGVPTRVDPPVNVDISDCACPANSRTVNRTYCPTGFTNSFDFEGAEQTGVSGIITREWVCPPSAGFGGMPAPGYWDLEVSFGGIPACTCDSSRTDIYVRSCPNGTEGAGIRYRREYDCVNNQWEPEANWELLENDCHTCTWQEPSGTPSNSEYRLGGASRQVGATCACGTEAAPLCWDYGGSPDPYNVWTNCQCVVQNN